MVLLPSSPWVTSAALRGGYTRGLACPPAGGDAAAKPCQAHSPHLFVSLAGGLQHPPLCPLHRSGALSSRSDGPVLPRVTAAPRSQAPTELAMETREMSKGTAPVYPFSVSTKGHQKRSHCGHSQKQRGDLASSGQTKWGVPSCGTPTPHPGLSPSWGSRTRLWAGQGTHSAHYCLTNKLPCAGVAWLGSSPTRVRKGKGVGVTCAQGHTASLCLGLMPLQS